MHEIAAERDDATYEIVDVADHDLPLLDEPLPPALSEPPAHPHTRRWAETIDSFDALVFVTPEYNHSRSGALKNAVDYLFHEWNDKAAGFVGYGSAGGTRAVEHLRQIMGEVKVADVRAQVALSLFTDFENMAELRPAAHQRQAVHAMLDEVVAWGTALRTLRPATQAA